MKIHMDIVDDQINFSHILPYYVGYIFDTRWIIHKRRPQYTNYFLHFEVFKLFQLRKYSGFQSYSLEAVNLKLLQ